MEFTKWNGCGNDFVFVNAMNRPIEPVTAECTKICDRHFGVGPTELFLYCLQNRPISGCVFLTVTAARPKCAETASGALPVL